MLAPAPGLTFEVRKKRIAFYFFNNLKFLFPVEAGKHEVAGLELESLTPAHDRVFAWNPLTVRSIVASVNTSKQIDSIVIHSVLFSLLIIRSFCVRVFIKRMFIFQRAAQI